MFNQQPPQQNESSSAAGGFLPLTPFLPMSLLLSPQTPNNNNSQSHPQQLSQPLDSTTYTDLSFLFKNPSQPQAAAPQLGGYQFPHPHQGFQYAQQAAAVAQQQHHHQQQQQQVNQAAQAQVPQHKKRVLNPVQEVHFKREFAMEIQCKQSLHRPKMREFVKKYSSPDNVFTWQQLERLLKRKREQSRRKRAKLESSNNANAANNSNNHHNAMSLANINNLNGFQQVNSAPTTVIGTAHSQPSVAPCLPLPNPQTINITFNAINNNNLQHQHQQAQAQQARHLPHQPQQPFPSPLNHANNNSLNHFNGFNPTQAFASFCNPHHPQAEKGAFNIGNLKSLEHLCALAQMASQATRVESLPTSTTTNTPSKCSPRRGSDIFKIVNDTERSSPLIFA